MESGNLKTSDVTLELKQVGVELSDLRLNSRDSRDTQLSLLKTQDVTHSRVQLVISLTPIHPLDRLVEVASTFSSALRLYRLSTSQSSEDPDSWLAEILCPIIGLPIFAVMTVVCISD